MLGAVGIKPGDALVSVNGERFSSGQKFVQLVRQSATLHILYVRLPDIPLQQRYEKVREVEVFDVHENVSPMPAYHFTCGSQIR